MRIQQTLLPDPTTNYQEAMEAQTRQERRDRSHGIRRLEEDFSAYFRKRHGLPPRGASTETAAQVPAEDGKPVTALGGEGIILNCVRRNRSPEWTCC